MIVYNVTAKILPGIETEWRSWLKQIHIPAIMATGIFSEFKIYKLLDPDDGEGPAYIVQYFTDSPEKYNRYIREFAPSLRRDATEKWGNRLIVFRTLLQTVD